MPLYKDSGGQLLDGNGTPYSGAKLYFYDEGTTTPKATYTTRALSVANANPVVADSAGRFGAIWLTTGRYKVVAKTSDGATTIYTLDGVEGVIADLLTARGDLLTRDANGYKRLALGTDGQVLTSDGTDVAWESGVALDAANTFTQPQTIKLTDNGASAGPFLTLERVSASAADADAMGAVRFTGRNDNATPETIIYGTFFASILDSGDGSEDGAFYWQTFVAGTEAVRFGLSHGFFAYGLDDKGDGTINAKGFYLNGTAFPITKRYASAAQTITSSGSLTLPHSLGAVPKIVRTYLKNISTELGYSVGEMVEVYLGTPASGANRAGQMKIDATNVSIKFGSETSVFILGNWSTGAAAAADNAKWELYVEAYA